MTHRPETLYGEQKRLRFMTEALRRVSSKSPLRVLELGCGTGQGLLFPLAETFKAQAAFTGVDFDAPSIAAANDHLARQPGLPLRFLHADAGRLPADVVAEAWDAVILSEVIEHVADPLPLLAAANAALKPGGLLLVTVPNGFGPYEVERFFWDGLKLDGALTRLRRALGRGAPAAPTTMADDNKHVGFYHWPELERVLETAGFRVREVQNREWFSGPFSDLAHAILKRVGLGRALVAFSLGMGSVVPRFAATDWMVEADKTGVPSKTAGFLPPRTGFRGWWWRVKRAQSDKAG